MKNLVVQLLVTLWLGQASIGFSQELYNKSENPFTLIENQRRAHHHITAQHCIFKEMIGDSTVWIDTIKHFKKYDKAGHCISEIYNIGMWIKKLTIYKNDLPVTEIELYPGPVPADKLTERVKISSIQFTDTFSIKHLTYSNNSLRTGGIYIDKIVKDTCWYEYQYSDDTLLILVTKKDTKNEIVALSVMKYENKRLVYKIDNSLQMSVTHTLSYGYKSKFPYRINSVSDQDYEEVTHCKDDLKQEIYESRCGKLLALTRFKYDHRKILQSETCVRYPDDTTGKSHAYIHLYTYE